MRRSIFERIAKLKSEAVDFGDAFEINVYDDELSTEDRVMWLDATVIDDYEDDTKYVYVNIVQFNDKLFFKMPQNRQDSCASALFKKFIKYYRENYEGLPVGAGFENYDLQEKFKVAIDKGIFPKESLNYVKWADKEEYDNSNLYNMDNRKLINLVKTIRQKGGTVDSQGATDFGKETFLGSVYMNAPLDDVIEIGKLAGANEPVLYTEIDRETIAYGLTDFPNVCMVELKYDIASNSISMSDENERNEFLDYLGNSSHPFYTSFGTKADSVMLNDSVGQQQSLKDALNNITTTASASRLRRK